MASRKLVVEILGDSKSLEKAFARSSRASRGFGASMQTIRRAAVGASVAVGGATALIAKSAIDFESSFAGVRKTVDASEKQFAQLEQGFLKLSRTIPINVNELNRLGEAAGQLGIARRGILTFTETAAKLGVTTNLSADQAAEGLARLSNILQTPQKDFGRLGSTIVDLGNNLAATEAELLEFGLRIAGAGKVARLTEDQILAIGGAMSSVGIEAEAGGTATSKVLLSMADAAKTGGKQLALFGEVAGTSAAGFRKAFEKDASKAFLSFVEGLGEIDEAGGNVFATLKDLGIADQRLIRSFLSLSGAGDLLRRSLDVGSKAWRENTALSKEAEERFRTTAAQMQLFKNNLNALAVQFGRAFLPGLQRALAGLTDFLQKVGEARTVRARLNVIWEGVQDAAQGATNALGRAVAAVDFDAVWEEARGIADGLQVQLEQVDFGFIGKRIGDGIAAAVEVAIPATKEIATRITAAIRAIDFVAVGKAAGPGLAAAIATALVTLADPAFWIKNWDIALAVGLTVFRVRVLAFAGKLAAPLVKLGGDLVLKIGVGMLDAFPRLGAILIAALSKLPALAAKALSPLTRLVAFLFGRLGKIAQFVVKVLGLQVAINAVVGFAKKVGQVFKNLGKSIGDALKRAFDFIKRTALKAAIAIIEPFTHIPGFLGGGAFRDLQDRWQATLDAMESKTRTATSNIQNAINGLHGKEVQITLNFKTKTTAPVAGTKATGSGFVIPDVSEADKATGAAIRGVEKRSQDANAEQVTTARRLAAGRKAAATRAEAAAAAAKAAGERASAAFEALLDSLNLGLEKALATRRLGDDLAALKKIENAILARIKAEGRTTDLARQLFQNRQQQAGVLLQQRKGTQFEALGLSALGEKITPSVGALTKRLGNVRNLVKGTFLDTAKTRSQLANIARVLSGAFGKVGKEVRAAILQMLNDISNALSGGGGTQKGPLTKFRVANFSDIASQFPSLSEDELKNLRQILARRGPGGTIPRRTTTGGAFGFEARGGMGGTGNFIINGPITVIANNMDEMRRDLEKRKRRGAGSRTGAGASVRSL